MKFYLYLHNLSEIWNLFSRVPMGNRFWCQTTSYILTLRKSTVITYISCGTRFLSSKNWNCSISDRIVSIFFTLFWVWSAPNMKMSWTTAMLNARFLCTCIPSPLRLKTSITSQLWGKSCQRDLTLNKPSIVCSMYTGQDRTQYQLQELFTKAYSINTKPHFSLIDINYTHSFV